MNSYKELQSKIEAIQKENKDVTKYKLLCEVKEPGKTSFRCKEGDLLVCLLSIFPKKRAIMTNEDYKPSLEEFMGVDPFIALVMESGCKEYVPGEVVHLYAQQVKQLPAVIVDAAVALVVPLHAVFGANTYLSVNK